MADEKLHTYEDEMAAQARGEETETRCECGAPATTELDGEPLCDGCYAKDVVKCPKCHQRGWKADATERGTCEECAVHCDSCSEEITEGEGHECGDDDRLCDACHKSESFRCPKCDRQLYNDDKAASGLCNDCRDEADTDLQSELDDLFGDDKGHLIRAALVAAKLIEG